MNGAVEIENQVARLLPEDRAAELSEWDGFAVRHEATDAAPGVRGRPERCSHGKDRAVGLAESTS